MVKKNTKINVNNLCRNWGIFLIIASIIQFLFLDIFDIYWAVVVLFIGIITLVFRKSWNLALIGGAFLLVGAYNIIIVLLAETLYAFLFGGIIQIGIGLFVLNQYHKIEEKEVSKKEGNWFKRHPVLSIFLALLIIAIIYSYLPTSIGDKVKQSLEEDNYEVLDVWYFDDINSPLSPRASVDMKSFGDLNKQAEEGLTTLALYYKNASQYSVTIFTPTSECYYSMDGAILNSYWKTLDKDYEVNEAEIIDTLAYLLWENAVIEEREGITISDVFDYESINENGITFGVLSSIIDYNIEWDTERCS